MKKFLCLFFVLSVLLTFCSCSIFENDVKKISENIAGNTYCYYSVTDDINYEVNGFHCLEVSYMTFNYDGTVTNVDSRTYTFAEDSPFKNNSSFQDYENVNTYEYVIRKNGSTYEVDIGGYGILTYTLEVDDFYNVLSLNYGILKYELWNGSF